MNSTDVVENVCSSRLLVSDLTMPAPALTLLVLKTHQLETLRRFYERIGFVFTKEQHGEGPAHYASCVDGWVLELYPLTENRMVEASLRLGFCVDDLESVLRAMEADAGHAEITLSRSGQQTVLFDPDGRSVELVQVPR